MRSTLPSKLVAVLSPCALGVALVPAPAQAVSIFASDCNFGFQDVYNAGDAVCVSGELDVVPPAAICAEAYVIVTPAGSANPFFDVSAGGANYVLGCAGAGAFFDEYVWLFPSEEYSDAGIPLLRPGNLHVSGIVRWTTDNTRFLPPETASQCADYVLRPGELVMNLTAQSLKDAFLGRVCILGNEWSSCLLNQRIARLTPTGINVRFCLWLFKSPLFRQFVDGMNQGTLIQHIYTSQVDEFVFGLPPVEEQERIVATIEHLWKLIDALEARRLDQEKATKTIVVAFPNTY